MRAIRRREVLIGVMLVMILLSFFSTAKERISGFAEYTISTHAGCIGCEEERIYQQASARPAARIVDAKDTLDDVIMREQKTVRSIVVRFLVIVLVLFYVIRAVYRMTIRRFGCHMIILWENICYIHKVDGEKENRLLYTW